MLWVATWVVASVTSAMPTASTYDQAACAEALLAEAPPPAALADDETDCRPQPIVAIPTVIDCNDPGMSPWVAEMIGSCDMPRPASPSAGAPMAVKGAHDGAARFSGELRGSHDAPPVRPASRDLNDDMSALVGAVELRFFPITSATSPQLLQPAGRHTASRLERPPRAV